MQDPIDDRVCEIIVVQHRPPALRVFVGRRVFAANFDNPPGYRPCRRHGGAAGRGRRAATLATAAAEALA
ncbi:hypothetical protein [Sorangium cellulosum]|uniref:hypothetical protein n=1 Tax=Sorangium cellulosum TaxID=56 RepID=UPI001E4DFA6E|nr:hypothetical protein [Sorangium cellulosum]